ncbi:NADP-dependent oxidoreductase domain-containing protein 1-like [Ylistrum balloti]|uniref:NADP-dependent oxidoreductase domain-containing protein 1-like n=1 Tax=Ylistrum balloti TaxID=509963 RepID=UPI00290595B1|nr:NADP-dependent oxidoreductase domain-containing protein 1-like [Ylistrum balloti]
MELMTRLKQASDDTTPVDIANNLETLQFESALSAEETQLLHLRNRTHAITVSSCAQATYFASVLHEARQLKKQLKSPQKRTAKILQDREPRDPLKVGIIGCGRLGSQLAHCLLTYGDMNPKDLKISTRRPETLEYLRNKGVDCAHDNIKLASTSHLIFLCVLPSHIQTVAEEICEHLPRASIVYSFVSTYTPKRLKQLLGTSSVMKPEYSWSEESERNTWNCNINVNSALEDPEIVEKTCPIGYRKTECVVMCEEKLAEIIIFAFINMVTTLRVNKEDALSILHIVMFEDIPEDHLREEDFIRSSLDQTGMFPRFNLTQLTEVTTSVLKRISTCAPLRAAFVKKYLGIFDSYVQQKNYEMLNGTI